MKKTNLYIASIALAMASNFAFAAGETAAYKLAVVDANQFVAKNGIEDKRAQAALSSALKICNAKTEAQLSDQSVAVSNLLNKDGLFTRPVDILEALGALHEGAKAKVDCASTMSQYATVRKSLNYTHSQAVAALRVLQNASVGSRQ